MALWFCAVPHIVVVVLPCVNEDVLYCDLQLFARVIAAVLNELRATSRNRFSDFLWVDIVMSNPFSHLYFTGAGAGTLF